MVRVIGRILAVAALVVLAAATVRAGEGLEPIKTVAVGKNGEFRVNGKVFIPIQAWLQDPQHFAKLREAGINTLAGYWWDEKERKGQGGTTRMGDYAKQVHEAGFYFIAPYMADQMDDMQSLAKSDFLLAWIHNDEPELPKKVTKPDGTEEWVPRDTLESTAERYRALKKVDTTRPVKMGVTANFMASETRCYDAATKAKIYPEYIKYCDAVGFDIYPIYGWNRPDWLYKVADGVTELRKIAGPGRPVSCAIECCKGSQWITYEKQLEVTPADTRAEVWMALIRGAGAINYFTHRWRPSYTQFGLEPEMVKELARLNAQITRLAPAIMGEPSKREIVFSLKAKDANGAEGEALACHFKGTESDGATWIFAQNMDMKRREGVAYLRAAGIAAGTRVEVVDEGREIIVKSEGEFSDEFGPLAVHIYRVKGTAAE